MTVWAGVLVDVRLLCGKDGGDDAYQGDDDAAADAQSDVQKAVELCLYSVEALHHGFLICLKPAEDAPDIWLVREFDLWLSGRLCRQLVRSGWVGVGVRGLVVDFQIIVALGLPGCRGRRRLGSGWRLFARVVCVLPPASVLSVGLYRSWCWRAARLVSAGCPIHILEKDTHVAT